MAEVNVYGDVYFSRYFEWQGNAREEFIRQCLPIDFSSGIKFVTKSASIEYYQPAKTFDEILIQVSFSKIKLASLEMRFLIYKISSDNKILLADGNQVIVFIGAGGEFYVFLK